MVSLQNEIINLHIIRLADTVSTTDALFDLHGVPRQVIVDDNVGTLQVQTFATSVRRDQHLLISTELLQGGIAFLQRHTAVDQRGGDSVIFHQLLDRFLGGYKLCKQDDLSTRLMALDLSQQIQQRFLLGITTFQTGLLCQGEQRGQLLDLILDTRRQQHKSILQGFFCVTFHQFSIVAGMQLIRLVLEHLQAALGGIDDGNGLSSKPSSGTRSSGSRYSSASHGLPCCIRCGHTQSLFHTAGAVIHGGPATPISMT